MFSLAFQESLIRPTILNMLKLGIVRHAKSSWNHPDLNDHDRPLNKRGERDAPIMAQKVKDLFGVPDLLLSSSANRAFTTASVFKEVMNTEGLVLNTSGSLYHASEQDILDRIAMIDPDVKSALIFGHNPGVTYLVNSFKGDFIDNVPTCGVIILESEAKAWMELDQSNTKRVSFIYPKMYV